MARNYENKASHNQLFLENIENDYPHEYFDWKVTVQFYIALHKCYCVLLANQFDVETNHKSNIQKVTKIDSQLGKNLHSLYKNSRSSRYDGFLTEDAMNRINKINYADGKKHLNSIANILPNYYSPQSQTG